MGMIAVKPLSSLARGETVPLGREGLLIVLQPDPAPEELVAEGLVSLDTFMGGKTFTTEVARCFYCTEPLIAGKRAVCWAGIPSDPSSPEGTLHVMLHPACARRLAVRLLRDAEEVEDAERDEQDGDERESDERREGLPR